ncbi:MAG TPA: N-6 DNA methylase, partial [Bacteroidales bacterium]|nr:N-6 DNA methylase [Bacteroidales bacterium]
MAANRIQIQNALHNPYDRVLFSREVLSPVFGSGFTLNASLIPATLPPNQSESAVIDKVWIYGKIQLDDSTEITCYEVLLQPKVRIEQSKIAIQQYVRKLLTAGQAALINFVAPANTNVWRLTLVAKDSVLTEKGVKEKTTHAKRYTFLLGPSETCKTAAERFETLSTEKEITFQTLVNAFSVEKLSKEFFNEYTLHYQNFCNYLQESNYRKSVFNITFPEGATKQEKDKASKPIRDFVKKLLGRIVFLYFVQKKGWLGASNTQYTDGMTDFIKQLFLQSGGNDAFYSNWLTVLFFDTLNKERPNDDFKMPDGKTVKVPYLNGGLFDKEEFDEQLLTFPAKLFHNPDFEDFPLTEKNKGNARGFLDFLDAFNFTVYEDSPDDHTVAVDPEMLGHIFENLLEDNKDKGAFYTPKEIVHYMCQESLSEYLCNTLQINSEVAKREAINQLLKNKVVDNILKPEIAEVEKALDRVKICDPAIGSGAFPMGLLQEIFSIKELIAYETGKQWNPAETKLNIIQNSIYGVDIEKGAVDIARLRFWLSLVVDEEKPKPLPNLDYKIVVGDSLISKFDDEIVEIDWERKQSVGKADEYVKNVQRLLVEVADKQKNYFSPNNTNKKKLQAEIRNLKIELLINQLSYNKLAYIEKTPQKGGFMPTAADIKHNTERELQIAGFDKLISKLKQLLQHPDEHFNHFDWKLDFPEVLNPYLIPDNNTRGFDIVMGNPPYIQLQKDGGKLAKMYESKNFQTFARTGDIYTLFYEKGIELIKENGTLCYITSNKWMRAGYGEKLRQFFINQNPLLLIDLGPGIFESATVDTNILLIQKAKNKNQLKAITYTDKNKTISEVVDNEAVILEKLTKDAWFIGSSAEQRLKEKIEKMGKPLKDWDVNIYYGIKTGLNEAFIITTEKRNEILANCKDASERKRTEAIIKPILRGRDIKRYYYEWAGLWVILAKFGFYKEAHLYTSIVHHLSKYEKELKQRGQCRYTRQGKDKNNRDYQGQHHWLELDNNPQDFYLSEFEKEKVVWGNISYGSKFCFVDKGIYINAPANIITTEKTSIKYLIAQMNSKIFDWQFKQVGIFLGHAYEWKKQYVEQVKIPPITASNQPIVEQIEALVDKILSAKKSNPQADTSQLEKEINNLVYSLYE